MNRTEQHYSLPHNSVPIWLGYKRCNWWSLWWSHARSRYEWAPFLWTCEGDNLEIFVRQKKYLLYLYWHMLTTQRWTVFQSWHRGSELSLAGEPLEAPDKRVSHGTPCRHRSYSPYCLYCTTLTGTLGTQLHGLSWAFLQPKVAIFASKQFEHLFCQYQIEINFFPIVVFAYFHFCFTFSGRILTLLCKETLILYSKVLAS